MALSARLHAALLLIDACDTFADIGTDHAFLPIEACKINACRKAIACDIVTGPMKIAQRNINEAGFTERIETRLGDGIAPLHDGEADCITICGMGGQRIIGILDKFPDKAKYSRLILQPQHDLTEVRRYLHRLGFMISTEVLVQEDSRFYVLMLAAFGTQSESWTEKEYFLGKHLIAQGGVNWQVYVRHQMSKIEGYIQSIPDEDTLKIAMEKLSWLKEEA